MSRSRYEALAAVAAVLLVAAAGGWRIALLAALAAGAVTVTRVRFAPTAAVVLLIATALAVAADGGA